MSRFPLLLYLYSLLAPIDFLCSSADGFIVPTAQELRGRKESLDRNPAILGGVSESMSPRDTVSSFRDQAAASTAQSSDEAPLPKRRRIIYVSLEYCHDDLFSGNGIAARSHVRGLSTLFCTNRRSTASSSSALDGQTFNSNNNDNDNDMDVRLFQEVIVARPISSISQDFHPSDTPPGVRLHVVPVSNWKTTDREFDHETFAQGVQRIISSLLLEENQDEDSLPPISVILAADWTGMAGVERVKQELLFQAASSSKRKIPVFFLNFRVYARMTNISEEDRLFYQSAEAASIRFAVQSGGAVMSLCTSDKESLQGLLLKTAQTLKNVNGENNTLNPTSPFIDSNSSNQRDQFDLFDHEIRIIWPMLRQEFTDIALRDQDQILDDEDNNSHHRRPYLACIVRLSKDKGPQRFVQVCRDISERDPNFWSRTGTIPLLAGAASQPDFGAAVKADLKECVPNALIVDAFLNPEELSALLQQSRLNIHPALYEAWGMTIVEAAACGVPTLLNDNWIDWSGTTITHPAAMLFRGRHGR